LLEPDFAPKPVYHALKDYIAQARVVTPGFRSTRDWAMEWSPGWKVLSSESAYFGEYKLSGGAGEQGRGGDSVSFVFRGTDLDLVALQNPYGGAVRVQIDSQAPRDIELWRTDAGVGGRIALARDLDDGEHRVTLTVTRAPTAINGFIVQRGNAGLRRGMITAVGLGLFLVVGAWFWKRALAVKTL
jgi:hypothetical protein